MPHNIHVTMKSFLFIGFVLLISVSKAEDARGEEIERSTGLVGMVRSVTKNVPSNLAIGPFNIDTRTYANTLVNLCRPMFIV